MEVMVHPDHLTAAEALKPIHARHMFGRSILLFDSPNREELARLGEIRTPSIADLFVAVMAPAPQTGGGKPEFGGERKN